MKNLMLGTLLAMFFAAPVIAGDSSTGIAPIELADAHSVEQGDNRGIGDERSEEAKQFGDQEHGKKKGHEKREDRDKKEKKKKKKKKDKKDKKDKKAKKKKDKSEDDEDDDEDDEDDDDEDEDDDEEDDDDKND